MIYCIRRASGDLHLFAAQEVFSPRWRGDDRRRSATAPTWNQRQYVDSQAVRRLPMSFASSAIRLGLNWHHVCRIARPSRSFLPRVRKGALYCTSAPILSNVARLGRDEQQYDEMVTVTRCRHAPRHR